MQIEKSNAQVESMNEQLNELREYLLLPTKEVAESEDLTLTNQLGQILKEYNQEKNSKEQLVVLRTELDKTLKLPEFDTINSSTTYDLEVEGEIYTIKSKGELLLTFGIENQKLFFQTPDRRHEFAPSNAAEFSLALKSTVGITSLDKIKANNELIQAAIVEITEIQNRSAISTLLNSKKLTQNRVQKKSDSYISIITSLEGQTVATIKFSPADHVFALLDENNKLMSERTQDIDKIASSLQTYLNSNTFESLLQKNVKSRVKEVQAAIDSSEFYAALQNANLTYASNEDSENYIYNFIDKGTKETVFQILVDKSDASVFIQKGETKKKLSFRSDDQLIASESSKNFLIAGKHGKLTDTIILMNIKDDSQKATLISIPRDLYTDGEKINSIYAKQGMPGLVAKVETVTGLPIENYVLIDMYAFIDVVDYLGGIDVFLDEEVVDPSYRTFDNGVWGTMYFAPGEHHLNGTQALRLARSRHYSSDFARAGRQQMLLQSLRDKSTELGFEDAKAIMQIAYTLLDKTETDLPVSKAVRYFFKYKNYNIADQNVLSTANVLTSSYSNQYLGKCDDCPPGAYILLPKNDDWGLIRTFVQTAIARN